MTARVFQFPSRTVAEVSLRALIKNLVTLRSISKKEVIPVVKADAYGHGMLSISRALVTRGGCHTLSVATLEEAIELRKRIPYAIQILVLSGFFPHQVDAFIKYRLIPVIHNLGHLKSLAGKRFLPEIHLKVDTGMHRLGILREELVEAVRTLKRLDLKLSGLATHFAESEDVTSHFIDRQIEEFAAIESALRFEKILQTDAKIHVANTGAVLRGKVASSMAVRPGIGLYGISPNPRLKEADGLTPILEWKTRVLCTKNVKAGETVGYGRSYRAKKRERIAILALGYADGFPRLLSNEGMVLLGGKRVPVRGTVSMDLTAVDCTSMSHIKEGSAAVLIGRDGKNQITAWDIANWARTIPYEILCGISMRVPRIYLD